MNAKILHLHPNEFYCPHCGGWHKLPGNVELCSPDLSLRCEHHPAFDCSCKISFHDNKVCSYLVTPCHKFDFYMYPHRGAVNISEFKEYFDGLTPTVELPVMLILQGNHPTETACNTCTCYKHCIFFDTTKYIAERFFETKIAFRFDPEEYKNYIKDQAFGFVKNAWGTVTELADKTYKEATSEDTRKKVSDFANKTSERISNFANEAYKRASDFADKAIEKASEIAEEVSDKASDFAEDACDKVSDFFDKDDEIDEKDDYGEYEDEDN